MTRDFLKRSRSAPWSFFLAVLCIVLLLVAGTAQAVHIHPDGTDTHADCSLCATAHVSVQLAHTPAAAPPVSVSVYLEPRAELRAAITVPAFALFTRPPPAA